jgi:GNAT superfamily N-acetyltransferase
VEIRAARPAEAELLTELAMRSKAYWGYSPEFMERCRPVLTVTPAYVETCPVHVAVAGADIVGFYSLRESGDELELDLMFVEPSSIGRGVGARLLAHALDDARATKHDVLVVESDPQAEPFYRRFGARRIALRESTVEAGRLLPILAFDLRRRRD